MEDNILLYRYEFFNQNDESLNVGLLQGLGRLNILELDEQNKLLRNFNNDLEVPPDHIFMYKKTKSHFTKKGEEKFYNDIQKIMNYVHNETSYKIKQIVTKILLKELNHNIAYVDEHQILTIVN